MDIHVRIQNFFWLVKNEEAKWRISGSNQMRSNPPFQAIDNRGLLSCIINLGFSMDGNNYKEVSIIEVDVFGEVDVND
ncbi:hypothetical protein SUGI_0756310 [Cryptomeria japonica]|nr:hypothetical protein SUGI_0756310 [Cryptomeria japonica]